MTLYSRLIGQHTDNIWYFRYKLASHIYLLKQKPHISNLSPKECIYFMTIFRNDIILTKFKKETPRVIKAPNVRNLSHICQDE